MLFAPHDVLCGARVLFAHHRPVPLLGSPDCPSHFGCSRQDSRDGWVNGGLGSSKTTAGGSPGNSLSGSQQSIMDQHSNGQSLRAPARRNSIGTSPISYVSGGRSPTNSSGATTPGRVSPTAQDESGDVVGRDAVSPRGTCKRLSMRNMLQNIGQPEPRSMLEGRISSSFDRPMSSVHETRLPSIDLAPASSIREFASSADIPPEISPVSLTNGATSDTVSGERPPPSESGPFPAAVCSALESSRRRAFLTWLTRACADSSRDIDTSPSPLISRAPPPACPPASLPLPSRKYTSTDYDSQVDEVDVSMVQCPVSCDARTPGDFMVCRF